MENDRIAGSSGNDFIIGGDISNLPDGAFLDAASEKIFEDKNKGMIA